MRQVLGTVLLWVAVGATAGIAVARALVVAPVSEEGSAAAAPGKTVGPDAIMPPTAAEAESAVAAREAAPRDPVTPPAAQIGRPAVEHPAAERQTAAPNPQPARRYKRTAARGYRERFQPFGHAFAWFSSRNRWR